MAKKKSEYKQPYRLSEKARDLLNRNFAAIRKGIRNVCELHDSDACNSMEKADFEIRYIEKVMAQPIAGISATLRAITEILRAREGGDLPTFTQGHKLCEKGAEETE